MKKPWQAQPPTRAQAWRSLVARLDLQDAAHRAPALRTFLDTGDAKPEPVYRTELALGPELSANLYFLEYAAVSPGDETVTSVCILSLPQATYPVSLKATRKTHAVLESLTASASGSAVVPFPDDPDFGRAVTVYARDAAAARRLLFDPARAVLKKALCERASAPTSAPTFLLGERQLLFSNSAPLADPTPVPVLELLAADLLSLYATFSVRL